MTSEEIEKIIELVEAAALYGTTRGLSGDRDSAATEVNLRADELRELASD